MEIDQTKVFTILNNIDSELNHKKNSISYKKPPNQTKKRKIKKSKNFLTQEENNMIQNALNNYKVNSKYNISLIDFESLLPNKWLTDSVIDFYLSILTKFKSDQYAFNTNLYTSISSDISNSAHWNSDISLANFKKIFFPICVNFHWFLIVYDETKQTLTSYDSLFFDRKNELARIK